VDIAQWRDNIPKLLQAKLIESFENSNYTGAVARPLEGLNADYQLLIDIRNFQISPPAAGTAAAGRAPPAAHVELAAKILGENGRIIGSRTFDARVPERETGTLGAVAALNEAFGKAATDLVLWTRGVI